MDPNAVVLEISSDEDTDWKDHDGRGIPDSGDDIDWLAELFLDEGNKGNHVDDSDEVVVVSEVSPSEKPGKKPKSKSSVVDLDDDCVILDNDPDKPVEVRNDKPGNDEDDSDDIVVVSEKGQVACRDYPHPRHLCIKFPFSTTPNQSHCDQCYCYVCDSLAPCVYWGNGSSPTDHCHATEKDELWKLERKNTKNGIEGGVQPIAKVADVALPNGLNSLLPYRPSLGPGQVPTPGSIHAYARAHARHPSPNFRPANLTNQIRRPVSLSKSKLHPSFLQQYMVAKSAGRAHNGYNNNNTAPTHTPVSRRFRHLPYSLHRGNSGNLVRQQTYPFQSNPVNPPVSCPPQSQTFTSPPTVNTAINQQWPQFSNNVQPQVNSTPFYQPNVGPLPEQATGQQSYTLPAQQPSYPVSSQTHVDTPTLYQQPSYPVSDNTNIVVPNQGTQVIDNAGPQSVTNEMNVVGPAGLSEYRFDWIFDDQPVEPGFVGGHGSYGLTDFSSDSSFIDTGPIFDF